MEMIPGSSMVEHSAVNRRVASSNLARGAKPHYFSDLNFRCLLNFGRLTFGSEPRRRWFKSSRADPLFSCSCSHFQIARRFEFPSIPSNNEDFGRNATFDLKTKVVSLSWPTQFGLSPPTGSWIVAQTDVGWNLQSVALDALS